MLESFVSFEGLHKKPYMAFIWTVLLTSVAIVLSIYVPFRISVGQTVVNLHGIFSVLFTIIPSVYFITVLFKQDEDMEEDEIEKHYAKGLWKRHSKDITIFLFFFAGIAVTYAVWSAVLPQDFFQVQLTKINEVRGGVGALTGNAVANNLSFNDVLFNNLGVMVFSFIFSILFGAGMVFILAWNASVLGVFIGKLSESIYHIPSVSLLFLPHGLPEIAGYVVSGIAGGIMSAAIVRGHHKHGVFRIVLLDSAALVGIAVLLILLGAWVEVFL